MTQATFFKGCFFHNALQSIIAPEEFTSLFNSKQSKDKKSFYTLWSKAFLAVTQEGPK